MPKVAAFHDVKEAEKPGQRRMHHDNDSCEEGRKIPQAERQAGTGGFRHCVDCSRLNEIGR